MLCTAFVDSLKVIVANRIISHFLLLLGCCSDGYSYSYLVICWGAIFSYAVLYAYGDSYCYVFLLSQLLSFLLSLLSSFSFSWLPLWLLSLLLFSQAHAGTYVIHLPIYLRFGQKDLKVVLWRGRQDSGVPAANAAASSKAPPAASVWPARIPGTGPATLPVPTEPKGSKYTYILALGSKVPQNNTPILRELEP